MMSILLILSQIVIDCIDVVLSAVHMKCDRVLRIVFASKKLAVTEGGKSIMKDFKVCTHHQIWH
jgi:hypothetical protein